MAGKSTDAGAIGRAICSMNVTPSWFPESGKRATAILGFMFLALTVGRPAIPDTPTHKSPMSETSACSLVKKAVAEVAMMSMSAVRKAGWYCEFSTIGDPTLFVIQIRPKCRDPEGCFTNLGWYAVERRTGKVGRYDIGRYGIDASGRDLMLPLD